MSNAPGQNRTAQINERKSYETCDYCYRNRSSNPSSTDRKMPFELLNKEPFSAVCTCSPSSPCRDKTCDYYDPQLVKKMRHVEKHRARSKRRAEARKAS